MDVFTAIRNRRSIRKFKSCQLSREQTDCLLEAAMCCPSACNRRPYEFVVVKSRQKIDTLRKVCPNWHMLESASLAIIVCARPDLEEGMSHMFWQQDCSAATQNILLQAEELGLGTCWCGVYPVEERVEGIRQTLALSEKCVPFSLIAVGVPDETPAAKGFYDKTRVTYLE